MSIILTFILLLLCIQLCKNYKQGFINSFLLSILIIPKNACIIGGIKFNIVLLLLVTIITYIQKKKILIANNPFYKSVLFYFVTTLFIIFFSREISLSNQISFLVKKWIEMFWLGLLSWNIFKTNHDYKRFIKKMYYCIIILSLYGIFEYIVKTNIYLDIFIKSFPDTIVDASAFITEQRGILSGRIRGTTEHPLDWGQRFTLLFMFFFIIRKEFKKNKFILLETLIFINIVLTGSRSSIIPIVIFLIYVTIHYYKKHLKKLLTIIITLFSCLLIFSNSFKENETIKTIQAFIYFWDEEKSNDVGIKGSSVSMRIDQLEEATYAIGNNFYYGFGYGYVTNMEDDHYLKAFLFGFESIILKILVEQGIIGLFCYIIMFYIFIRISHSYLKKATSNYNILMVNSFIFSYFISLLLTGERRSFQLFFFLLIIIVNYLKTRKQQIILKR